MSLPGIPPDDADRLAALREYSILDSEPEAAFDDLVELASAICETPVATISLIDASRQWYKSRVGLPFSETPRDVAFCAHTILGDEMLEVPDMREDRRFADNPAVAGAPNARFYAGTLLRSERGYKLGTLCVLDLVPRILTPLQRTTLLTLGHQVERLLELRLRVRDLERAQRSKADLVAYVVHDLKSPLQAVMFSAEAVAEDPGLSTDARVALDGVSAGIYQLDRMITNLLAVGRAEDGLLRVKLAPVDLAKLVGEVTDVSRRSALRAKIVIGDAGAAPSTVNGDSEVLRRVLANLIDNALKYGATSIRCELTTSDAYVTCRVIDDGPGIPAEAREAVFHRRSRLSRDAGTDDARSHGLGLAFCRLAIEAHGGSIWIEDTLPRGATFSFQIPRTPGT